MIVLGLDTAGGSCSVALWEGDPSSTGTVLARRRTPMSRGHAESLVPEVERLLDRVGLAPSAIDLIAASSGPGGFTGLRIGLAAAGGLALATGARIVGVPSLEATAWTVAQDLDWILETCGPERDELRLLCAIESRRREIFVALFRLDPNLSMIAGPACLAPTDVCEAFDLSPRSTLIAGSAADVMAGILTGARLLPQRDPDPGTIARMGAARQDMASVDPPMPIYLRPPDAVPMAPARGVSRPFGDP